MAEFTVVVGTARGAFEHLENAKQSAMDLAYKNRPAEVWIEDNGGKLIFVFAYVDEVMYMTTIKQETLEVDYDIADDS